MNDDAGTGREPSQQALARCAGLNGIVPMIPGLPDRDAARDGRHRTP